MHRAKGVALHHGSFRLAGLIAQAIEIARNHGVDRRVDRLCPGDAGLGQFYGRQLAPADELAGFNRCQVCGVGHVQRYLRREGESSGTGALPVAISSASRAAVVGPRVKPW